MNIEIKNDNKTDEHPLYLKLVYSIHKGCKLYYNTFVLNEEKPNCCSKWQQKLNSDIRWQVVFHKIQKIREIRLKWLQIRIVHRILGTNVVLKHMGETETDQCTLCTRGRESIEHLFWRCEVVNTFWTNIQALLKTKCVGMDRLTLTENLVLFGVERNVRTEPVFDEIILTAKMYIFKCKYSRSLPCPRAFQQYLTHHYNVLQYNAKINSKYEEFEQGWMQYRNILVAE